MTIRNILAGACSMLAIAAAWPQAGAQTTTPLKSEIKIGVLTDMSSVFSDLVGPGSVLAAQMAADDFEKAEKPPFKIQVISADHSNKPDIAASIARRWIDEEKVDVITDVAGASVTLAVSKLAAQKDRIVLATASGQNSLSGEDCQPTLLHWSYNTRAVSGTTARAITEVGGKTWFFLTGAYAGGQSMEEDATRAVVQAGGQVLGSVKHPFPNQDFSSQLLTAQASGAKVIGLANAGVDATTAIRQAREFGLDKTTILSGLNLYITDIHAMGLDVAKNMYVTEPFYWDMNDETRAWSKRFFEQRKKMPTQIQAGLYSATMHYLKAVKAAGTADAGPVLAKMRATHVHDMFAKDGWLRDDNILIHDMYLFQVKSPDESKYPWDYYKLVRTVPGNDAFAPLSESRCPLVKKSN